MSHRNLVCPISMAAQQVKPCHPNCKFLDDKGRCQLLIALQKYLNTK